jgi:hypothetical protein
VRGYEILAAHEGFKMSQLDNSKYRTPTGGKLRFIRQFTNESNGTGVTFDLSNIQFEDKYGVSKYVKIFNTGSKSVYIAFDSDHEDMDIKNPNTYNFLMSSSTPFNEITIEGECSKISGKCASGESTAINVIVW